MKTFSDPVTFAFLAAVGLARCSPSTNPAESPGPATNAGAGGTGVGGSGGLRLRHVTSIVAEVENGHKKTGLEKIPRAGITRPRPV